LFSGLFPVKQHKEKVRAQTLFQNHEINILVLNHGERKGSDAYGMIHADIYPDNILIKDGGMFPIDFEDCGFDYWLWDIGVALEQQPWTETWRKKRDAFLEGYIRAHALPESLLWYIDLFMAANYASGVLWASAFILDDPAGKDEHEN